MEQAQTPAPQVAAPAIVQFPTALFGEIVEAVGNIRPNREIGPVYKALLKIAARANQEGVFAPTTPLTVEEFQNIEKFLNDREPKYVTDVLTKIEVFVNEYNEQKRLESEAAAAAAAAEEKAKADKANKDVITDVPTKSESPAQ